MEIAFSFSCGVYLFHLTSPLECLSWLRWLLDDILFFWFKMVLDHRISFCWLKMVLDHGISFYWLKMVLYHGIESASCFSSGFSMYGFKQASNYLRRESLSFGMVGNGIIRPIFSILECIILYFLVYISLG
jgi:hypothetical protein